MRVMRCLSDEGKLAVDILWIHEYAAGQGGDDYDFLIYNSFADEGHETKYDAKMVDKADARFHRFSGKKILYDSHDNGTVDGFARMADKTTPRIKSTPGWDFMKEYNVIMGFPIITRWQCKWRGEEKDIPVMYSYMNAPKTHTLRQQVKEALKGFQLYTKRHPFSEYARVLRRVKVCVSVAGTGMNGSSFGSALAANAVAFTHEVIKKVQVFPFGELIDDVNYVSFNVDNAVDRLSALLKDEEKIRSIGTAGRALFNKGYNPPASARALLSYLERI